MRLVSWAFVVCTVLGAIAIFLPAVELRAGDHALTRRTSLSLYQIESNRELVRRAFTVYAASHHRRVASALGAMLMPHTRGELHEVLDDTTSAMSTLDEVTADDVRTAGRALLALLVVLALLQATAAGLVFANLMSADSRGRMIGALALGAVIAVIAFGSHVGLSYAVGEANDELGRAVFGLGSGAWVMPIAAAAALAAAIALLAMHVRAQRRR